MAIGPTVSMRAGRYWPPSMMTFTPGVVNSSASRTEFRMIDNPCLPRR